MDLWSICWISITSLSVIASTHWIYKWYNPKCNGKLPPGSMGLPLIGETIQFIIPSRSLDIPHFVKKRIQKYGPLFRTNLMGKPVIISSNADFNHYLLQQEGKLVERWFMDSFSKLLKHDATKLISNQDNLHKYLRNLVLSHFGLERLKDKLIPELEAGIRKRLQIWSTLPTIDTKNACAAMVFDFSAKILFGYDPEKSGENLGESLSNFLQGFMSIPLNIPGTAFHNCIKTQKRAIEIITNLVKERRDNPQLRRGDFLDQILEDMKKDSFWTDEIAIHVMFWLNLASFETISSTLGVAIQFLTDNPLVVEKMRDEHEAIIKNRENKDSGLTWKEYKSMTYTHQVVNEANRMASVAPGLLRKAITDIQVDGYTIPKDWIIMVVPASIMLDSNTYKDPLKFDPSRWNNVGSVSMGKNFVAFGGGSRACAGAEFSKVLIAIFFHVFVTDYRWTKIQGANMSRTPALGFGNGYRIKVTEKQG
ncbi:beta-amyrin 16-alpha-hydroxylase CYP87D16-like [Mercurialis annua]|uniref:beta-amyrin 16-alpha-hydroxylase CYP87D16-like n=1 Tax=Mercurialis annua TaxID=3986 RepID=UPI002160C2C1|nr:beta-amyrin 16-alpha-hydroxylase CYP87D16-like [Mercurialis annua]